VTASGGAVATLAPSAVPYRAFDVRVVAVQRLSPSFVRIGFGGLDLAAFADHGHDQRIKLVLPLDGTNEDFGHFPRAADWYGQWRTLPEHQRNPIRTYTVAGLDRPGTPSARLYVDMVLHGDSGPATRWAARARIGDRLLIVGPNRQCAGDTSAVEFRPGPAVRQFLIGADAAALPAAVAIARELPADSTGVVVLEVPDPGDRCRFPCPPGMDVRWLVRTAGHGDALAAAAVEAAAGLSGPSAGPGPDPEPVDPDLLWEVPQPDENSSLYIWLAGEAGTVTRIRRRLVQDLNIDRKSVVFLGYWREGRPEG
jgi:NADPH-dependent ferric siderophore reductase